MIRPMTWDGDVLRMLDQRALPNEENWLALRTCDEVVDAIKTMAVRGAPAIGVAAAYGMALAALRHEDRQDAGARLAASRPTAVNLFWAIERINRLPAWEFRQVLAEAQAIEAEDLAMNRAIGENGSRLIRHGWSILTICNTGSLATSGHGTAFGVIHSAHAAGKQIHVYSCETRPRQQGLRLTAYELLKEGIPFHSIADGAAASLMKAGKVNCVIAGADRIAANGDSANKIGTYSLAVLAKHHAIPFYIAAPSSTFDCGLASGEFIPIEERDGAELTRIEGVQVAPVGTPVYNPAFDVTPGELIEAIISEKGIYRAPYAF